MWHGRTRGLAAMTAVALMSLAPARPARGQEAGGSVPSPIRFHGYSNLEWEKSWTGKGRGDLNGSFDAQEIDLVMLAEPARKIRVSADFRFEHGAATEEARGNVALNHGFVEYAVVDAFKVRAGKMLVPFGVYNEIHNVPTAFVSYKAPLTTNKPEKMGAERRWYSRWGSGFALTGNLTVGKADADYDILLSNGESDVTNAYEQDDNKPKSVTARFRVSPVPTLRLGASYYYDVLTDYADGEPTGIERGQNAIGAFAQWSRGKSGVEVEWLRGTTDASASRARATGNAVSGVVSQEVGYGLTPYVRLQWIDPNNAVGDDTASIASGGLNVNIRRVLVLKFEIDRTSSGAKNKRFKGVNYTEFVSSVSVAF